MSDARRPRKSRSKGLRPFPVIPGASVETLFWLRVDRRGADECWPWLGTLQKQGYGTLSVKRDGKWIHRLAYVVSFELAYGPRPDGLRIDHRCHNGDLACPGGDACWHRRCVNPSHLEAVTARDNARRSHAHNAGKTHCPQGHEYTPENIYRGRDGSRQCRTCSLSGERAARERRWRQGLTDRGTERRQVKGVVTRYLEEASDGSDRS